MSAAVPPAPDGAQLVQLQSAVLRAASAWEKARSSWSTRSIDFTERRPVTTQAQLHAAEERLAEAVRAWRKG